MEPQRIPAHFEPDPAGRAGHWLNPATGDVVSFGADAVQDKPKKGKPASSESTDDNDANSPTA